MLDLSGDDGHQMLHRALKHYAKRLMDLPKENDDIKIGNDVLQHNLDTLVLEVNKIEEQLTKRTFNITIHDAKQLVCCALMCYIKDLEDSKEAISKKLGGAKPELREVDNEIHLAKFVKNEVCG